MADTITFSSGIAAIRKQILPADAAALSLFEDAERRLWIGTTTGLWQVAADGALAAVSLRSGRQPHVYAIAEAADRSLWLGTSSGLMHRDRDGRVERYRVGQREVLS